MTLKITTDSELYRRLRTHYINRDPWLIYEAEEDPTPKFVLWLESLQIRVEFRPHSEHSTPDAVGLTREDLLWVTPNPQLTMMLLGDDTLYHPV